MRRGQKLWAIGLSMAAVALAAFLLRTQAEKMPEAFLRDVGPRLISNQTAQPIAVYGDRLMPGDRLHLGAPFNRDFPLVVLDQHHAFARLPRDLEIPASTAEVSVSLSLSGERVDQSHPRPPLTVVNDSHFPDLTALALSRDGAVAFVLSSTTDELFAIRWQSASVRKVSVGDGPSALANWLDPQGREWIAVAHQFAPELRLIPVEGDGAEQRTLPAPAYATGVAIDPERQIAFVAEHARDSISALSLSEGARISWAVPVALNPRAIGFAEGTLAVGSLQTGEVELLDGKTGGRLKTIAPTPATSIVGGRTERYQQYVMGGKAPRAVVWSTLVKRWLVASIGPNIGPNPDRWEVSPNGGIGVLDPETGKFERHLGFGNGVTEALAVDDKRGLLYAADIGVGLVRVVDLRALAKGDADARRALRQEIPILPPPRFPSARPSTDYGISGRAGIELHSGPKALALTPDGSTLLVLNRFTGTLAVLDVRDAARGRAIVTSQIPIVDTLEQPERRLGQIGYFTDLGRSGMSCDACHLEGHTEGVFFEKTHPMRIYRSTTIRGARETPPYFTPASTFSLAQTARVVGDRNRFHNPSLSASEVAALASYTASIATLPNPFLTPEGAPSQSLVMPDGAAGNPRNGIHLFEGKANCSTCHPAPLFTTDQDLATRGRYQNVGTPTALSLRLPMQELLNRGFAPPSLLGAWDVFPMLTSGAAGLEVGPGGVVSPSTRFPLRAVVEMNAQPPHGSTASLTPQELNDLLAYVLSL